MIKKDYLIRQIEEFGKVLALIRNFLKSNESEKFEKEISNAVLKYTSLELNYVESLNDEEFTEQILDNATLSHDQKKMLADLLFEKMHFYMANEEDENYLHAKFKCLLIYNTLMKNSKQNEYNLDIHYKIQYLNTI